jgi:transposase-like protein
MRPSRFTPEQILEILRKGDEGQRVVDICRAHGIHKNTYYGWRARRRLSRDDIDEQEERSTTHERSGGPATDLRDLQVENRRLMQVLTSQALEIVILKAEVSKK